MSYAPMLRLFSYPDLYGVADNNPYGLKIYAFLKLCKLAFQHEHILDTKSAPRGQLPYLVDGEKTVGDSDAIISHLITRYALTIDDDLTANQRDTDLLVRRMLDDLYWVMSYSRWVDPRFWPLFREALLTTHPDITEAALEAAREYNFTRYHYQGIGRYEPEAVYARGIAGPCSWQRFSIRGPASQHRCGHLWIYGQYVFLCDRHPFEELSPIAAKSRGALSSDPRCARRLSDHGCRDRCHRRMRNAKAAAQFKLFLLRVKLTSRSTRIICSTWLYAA